MALPTFVKIANGQPVINIGAMRHSITVQAFGPTSPPTYNDSGPVYAWTDFATEVRAAIGAQSSGAARSGQDVIREDQTATQLFLQVAVWASAVVGVLPSMRVISDNGSTYVIQTVEDVLDMGVVVVLTCLGIGAND